MYNKLSRKFDQIIYGDGLRGVRSHDSAEEMKWVIENGLVLKPILFETKKLKHAQKIESFEKIMGIYTQKMSWMLRSHVFPIISYNTNVYNRLKNDIHVILLSDFEDSKLARDKVMEYHYKRPRWVINDKEITFPFIDTYTKEYKYDGGALPYMVLRHKEGTGVVMGCPKRKRRCKKQCYYRKDYSRLLNDDFMSRYGQNDCK